MKMEKVCQIRCIHRSDLADMVWLVSIVKRKMPHTININKLILIVCGIAMNRIFYLPNSSRCS